MDWSFSPVFGSYSLVSLIAVGLLFVLVFVIDTHGLKRAQRWILRLLRLMLILALLLVILKPGVSWTKQREPEGTIAVLMDKSSSMQLSAGEGNKSRWDQQIEVWSGLFASREQLGKQIRFAPFAYDSQLQSLGEVESTAQSPPAITQLSHGIPDWYPPKPNNAPAMVLTVICVLKSAIGKGGA